jgi:hypothetical protein
MQSNYFKNQSSSSSFLLIIIKAQNDNGVLNRLVPCLKCMELACLVLQASLDKYYLPYIDK